MTTPKPKPLLTRSERRTLALLANGRKIPDLSAEMFLTRETFHTQARSAYRKLRADNLQDAVLAAVRLGVLRPDEIVTGPFLWVAQLNEALATIAALRSLADHLETREAYGGRADGLAEAADAIRDILNKTIGRKDPTT